MKEVAKLRRTSGVTAARRAAATADRCKNMVLVNWRGWEWGASLVASDVLDLVGNMSEVRSEVD